MSVPAYPRDRLTCMSKEGPMDQRFQIPGGTLQYKPQRDSRFPYLYKVPTHSLVHSPEHIKTILIHIVDTSIKAREARAKYETKLSVPLGPNANMDNYGQFSSLILFKFQFIFYFVTTLQVYWNSNLVQYYLPDRLPPMVYTMKKTT